MSEYLDRPLRTLDQVAEEMRTQINRAWLNQHLELFDDLNRRMRRVDDEIAARRKP